MIKKREDFFYCILIFLALFLSGSYVVTNNIVSSGLTIVLWSFLLLLTFYKFRKFNTYVLFIFLALILIIFVSSLINGADFFVFGKNLFSFFTLFVIFSVIPFSCFKRCYNSVVYILSIISLVLFFAYVIFPGLKSINPVSLGGSSASNLYIYVHPLYANRNCGMFWEPGAFQTFISLALLLEVTNKKINPFHVVVYSGTIITTFSTTGYLALAFCFLLLFIAKFDNRKVRRTVFVAALVGFALIFLFKDYLFDHTTNSVFGKIVNFFERNEFSDNSRMTSSSVRYYSVIKPFKVFLDNFFFGAGYNQLLLLTQDYTNGMNTCTFVNWFAIYGVFFGTLMLIGYYYFSKKITAKPGPKFIALLILFIITASEDYVNNAFFMLLALYGWSFAVINRRQILLPSYHLNSSEMRI